MQIIQTTETLWEVDERDFAEHANSDYHDWMDDGGDGTHFGFVKVSVAEFGTELFGLKLVETDTTFTFER